MATLIQKKHYNVNGVNNNHKMTNHWLLSAAMPELNKQRSSGGIALDILLIL